MTQLKQVFLHCFTTVPVLSFLWDAAERVDLCHMPSIGNKSTFCLPGSQRSRNEAAAVKVGLGARGACCGTSSLLSACPRLPQALSPAGEGFLPSPLGRLGDCEAGKTRSILASTAV